MKGKFDNLINGEQPILIDFFATWCGPCQALAPVLKEVARDLKGRVRVIKIDVDKNQMLSQKYQVRGVPTLALFRNGKIVWRQSGVLGKHQIISEIKNHLVMAEE